MDAVHRDYYRCTISQPNSTTAAPAAAAMTVVSIPPAERKQQADVIANERTGNTD